MIDFCMLNKSCIPGVNPTWSWYITIFIHGWIQLLNILWRVFVHRVVQDIGLSFCFVLVVLFYLVLLSEAYKNE